jgi:cysteine dioxygenase
LCWDAGVTSSIHGHGGKNCWVYQLQGTVDEIRYKKEEECLKETHRTTLTPGGLTYMHDRMGYHSIANNSTERAMTLHIYASPIISCEVYNDSKACFEMKEMSYHTFKGKEIEAPSVQ